MPYFKRSRQAATRSALLAVFAFTLLACTSLPRRLSGAGRITPNLARVADEGSSHGLDPALPSMHAIFLARGPAFRENAKVPAFDNIDFHPLLLSLVEAAPAANDGSVGAMRSLKPTAPTASGSTR